MESAFEGITVPVLMPCGSDGMLDKELYREHIRFMERSGISGLFVGGTAGEFINYSNRERMEQLALAVETVERMEVLYNITAMNVEQMLEHIRCARSLGVRRVSVTAPYYHKYDRTALLEYFSRVSRMTEGLSLYIYNMPDMTGNAVGPEILVEITRRCGNLRGVKDSSMNFTNLQELVLRLPEDFEVMTGNDAEILPSLDLGCKGVIVALANVYPELCTGVYEHWQRGDAAGARQYQNALILLRSACRSTLPIMSHKYLLSLRGRRMGQARFPMRELTAAEKLRLQKAAEVAEQVLAVPHMN